LATPNLTGLEGQLTRHLGATTASGVDLVAYMQDSVKALAHRWAERYIISSTTGDAVRNTSAYYIFEYDSPPVIQQQDERAIILMAAIIIRTSARYEDVGNAVTWKDDEIAYSGVESAKQKEDMTKQDWEELNKLFPVRLARSRKRSLYGYKNNSYEYGDRP